MPDNMKPPQLPPIDRRQIPRSEPFEGLALLRLEQLVGPSPLEDHRVIDFLRGPWDRTRKVVVRRKRLGRLGLGVLDHYMRQDPGTSWHDVAHRAAFLRHPDLEATRRPRPTERAIETARGYLMRLETTLGGEWTQARVTDRFPRLRRLEHRQRELEGRIDSCEPGDPWPPNILAELVRVMADLTEERLRLAARGRIAPGDFDLTPTEIRALARRLSFDDSSVRAWQADPKQLIPGRNVDLAALRHEACD